MTETESAIRAEGLKKRFGKTAALDGLDLNVPPGIVYGLLGPNGAGKTTAVRIFTTLLKADAGTARVAGLDVERDATMLRTRLGLSGQYAAVDELLTGRQNLVLAGRLYHLSKKTAERRAAELLEQFDLTEAADRIAKTYSGGMRRRLDLAASLLVAVPVLILDEPTTGLDPRSRAGMWDVIGDLVGTGTTVLLTTQYLEEADRLASRIAVIDHGKVVAEGTAAQLKDRVGGDRVEIVVEEPQALEEAARVLAGVGRSEPDVDRVALRIGVAVGEGAASLLAAVRALDDAGVALKDVALRRPTLDDAFLQLTGHAASTDDDADSTTDKDFAGVSR